MHPLRVVFIGHDVNLAGGEIALANFLYHIDRERFRIHLILPRQGPIVPLLEQQRIPISYADYPLMLRQGWSSDVIMRQGQMLLRLVQMLAPDVVVVNTSVLIQAVVALLTTHFPLVVHLHGFIDMVQVDWLHDDFRRGQQMWFQFPEKLLAPSSWLAKLYIELVQRELSVIPNCVPPPHTTAPYGQRDKDPSKVVMLATIESNKRPDLLVEIARLIQKNYPSLAFECRIYGNTMTEYASQFRKLIVDKGVQHLVKICDKVADPAPVYQQASVVVVLSQMESFSMVVAEAAAHGRPVVATRCGGPDDLVVDGETGYLIPLGDVQAGAERIAYLLQNPDSAEKMGQAARKRYENFYSPEIVVSQYQDALEEAIAINRTDSAARKYVRPFAQYFLNAPDRK